MAIGLRRLFLVAAMALVVATLPACRKKSVSDFTPAAGNARTALEAALNSWKDGQPAGGFVPGASRPTVQAEDVDWSAGQKLREFEILADEGQTGDGSARVFRVRLTLEKGAPREVKYMVVGIDPMLVQRDTDYEKTQGLAK